MIMVIFQKVMAWFLKVINQFLKVKKSYIMLPGLQKVLRSIPQKNAKAKILLYLLKGHIAQV